MPLIGPKKKPALKKGDFHCVVNDETEIAKIYNSDGKLIHRLPVLAKGWNGRTTWRKGGDTPPGLYRAGTLFVTQRYEDDSIWESFGKFCYDLEEQENQENERGRSAICAHGKAFPLGNKRIGDDPQPHLDAADQHPLMKTSGCLRFYNGHLEKYIVPLTHEKKGNLWVAKGNTLWFSVYQDYD